MASTNPIRRRPSPKGMGFEVSGRLHGRVDSDLFPLAARALHMVDWTQKTRFSKRCGNEMRPRPVRRPENAFLAAIDFPRLAPAVIVLVERETRCLLPVPGIFTGECYSVLAGFVEPGETLEETVAREVKEESGIVVKDIRYFGSQPWPFPDSLMIGFTA